MESTPNTGWDEKSFMANQCLQTIKMDTLLMECDQRDNLEISFKNYVLRCRPKVTVLGRLE
ncbi:unnamed protein product [Callosobruchus maculatus]|uniref:Uncharacterized protein n=1 Tax=Callosobruchus maculatus TaxID=64391 RepID=A0A653D6M2_CALMS|nr:unnamed protein product [Callosobruchus maculatus]